MSQNYCVYCMNPSETDVCPICGKNQKEYQSALHHLQPGTILNGKYLVGVVLGEGGFGITYIGRDINLDYRVAIKEYYPSGVVGRYNTYSNDITVSVGDIKEVYEKGKSRFLTEARTLAKFATEPSIVSVHDFFSENNTAYIAMDYLEGIDLREYHEKCGKMTFLETVRMLSPIMTALGKIHAQGLIHRDISPANIMVLEDGSLKLLDFGAARDVSDGEKSLSVLLKPGYAPEEQYRTRGVQGPWTDVYALSATMYKMLTGVTPEDSMNRLYLDDLERITELNANVTSEQEAVIFKGMAVRQTDRYQTVDELQTACMSCLRNSRESINNSSVNKMDGAGIREKPKNKKLGTAFLVGSIFCGTCAVAMINHIIDCLGWPEEFFSYDIFAGYIFITILFIWLTIFLWKKRKKEIEKTEV